MISLRRAMMDHDIPSGWTTSLSNTLGVTSVEDIKSMDIDLIRLVPKEFWQPICDMRNFYKGDDATMWFVPANWE